jgi:hypothetical protein
MGNRPLAKTFATKGSSLSHTEMAPAAEEKFSLFAAQPG